MLLPLSQKWDFTVLEWLHAFWQNQSLSIVCFRAKGSKNPSAIQRAQENNGVVNLVFVMSQSHGHKLKETCFFLPRAGLFILKANIALFTEKLIKRLQVNILLIFVL